MDELENLNRPIKVNYFDQNNFEEDLPIQVSKDKQIYYSDLENVFNKICDDITVENAGTISYTERNKTNKLVNDFVYGEITFQTLAYIYEHINIKFGDSKILNGIFIDLGSGSGRALIAAKLLKEFDEYIGIELLKDLYNVSMNLKAKFDIFYGNSDDSKNISFLNKDFLSVRFEEYDNRASFILANCKTFPKQLMQEIANHIRNFRKGCILLTTTQTMNDYDKNWEIIETLRKNMSWGTATLYIHIKK